MGGYGIISTKSLRSKSALNTFTVEIKHTGIRIGVAPKNHDLNILVGDTIDSWALASNGDCFHDGKHFIFTNEMFDQDLLTVELNTELGELKFKLNGKVYGDVFQHQLLRELELYPAFSLLSGSQISFK